jgi:phosphoribosylaminoimidazolecarboxamide formyltransferase/IMP cyclohydrolase
MSLCIASRWDALTLAQRKQFAAKAFEVVMHYDIAISNYFNTQTNVLRYGENPHQQATLHRKSCSRLFTQLAWQGTIL